MTDAAKMDNDAFKDFERNGYSGVAEGYDQSIAKVTSQADPAILDAVGAETGKTILDVVASVRPRLCAALRYAALISRPTW